MSDRRMIYPYTLTAKVMNFPYKYHFNHSPYYKFYIYGIILCIPIFYKIQQLSCSEANYANYAKYLEKEEQELKHHREHLL